VTAYIGTRCMTGNMGQLKALADVFVTAIFDESICTPSARRVQIWASKLMYACANDTNIYLIVLYIFINKIMEWGKANRSLREQVHSGVVRNEENTFYIGDRIVDDALNPPRIRARFRIARR